MTYNGIRRKKTFLELTVIEYFTDLNTVHVHSKHQIDPDELAHPRLLTNHLVTTIEILKNRTHHLYYVIPTFGTIIPLNDIISFEVFFEWFHRNVNNLYAVIVNQITPDFKKVVELYVNNMTTTYTDPAAESFKQTVAKPFSHRPTELEIDSADDRSYSQLCKIAIHE